MFNWFRKKTVKPPSDGLTALVGLPDDKFSEAVVGMFAQAAPAECAMTVVAIYNLNPMMSAAASAMARDQKPFSEEAFLRQMLGKDMSDPLIGRRLWWFSSGLLVRRLDRLAMKNPPMIQAAAQVWAALVEGAQHAPALLKINVVWSSQEKEFVLMSMSRTGTTEPSPREAMLLAVRAMLPKSYQGTLPITSVMAKHRLTFFGP